MSCDIAANGKGVARELGSDPLDSLRCSSKLHLEPSVQGGRQPVTAGKSDVGLAQ